MSIIKHNINIILSATYRFMNSAQWTQKMFATMTDTELRPIEAMVRDPTAIVKGRCRKAGLVQSKMAACSNWLSTGSKSLVLSSLQLRFSL